MLVLGDVFNSTGNPGLLQWRGGLCGLRGPGIKNCDYATEVGGYRHHTQNPDKLPVGISRTPEVGERGVRPSRECWGWPVPGCRRHPRPADALRLTPQRARLLRGSFPELRLAAGSEAAPHPNSQQQARRGEVSGTFQERIVHPLSTPGEPLPSLPRKVLTAFFLGPLLALAAQPPPRPASRPHVAHVAHVPSSRAKWDTPSHSHLEM